MARTIYWRLHTVAPPEHIFTLWTSDEGRECFWAERSRSEGDGFRLCFTNGLEERCRILEAERPGRFAFTYFGSRVLVELASDRRGGTDLTLTNSGVAEADYEQVLPGWLNVLLPLKAWADFGIDLRNHDPARSWSARYVDQ